VIAILLIAVGIVIGLAVVGFAGIGAWGCLTALLDGSDTRALQAREARQAEAEIAQIGRRAQEAILDEALKRFTAHDRDR
jgi:hypothetical protein